VRKFLSVVGLSFFDRLLGAAFGLLRGAVVAVALLTAWIAFGPRVAPGAMVHSQIAPYLMRASDLFVSIAPADLKKSFREVYDEAQKQIKNIARPSGAGGGNRDSGK